MPRTRRSGEDARTAIMDAAERRLVAAGGRSIRLQDVAAEVGIAHPTVLHHFGSRERLLQAVLKRRVAAMNEALLAALAEARPQPDEGAAVALFERVFEALAAGGHARVAAFLALEGRVPGAEPTSLRPLAEAAHQTRLTHATDTAPDFEDTYFTVLLSAFALFGEAIVGPLLRGEPEAAPDLAVSQRFRAWTARLVLAHLSAGALTRRAREPPG